MLLLTTSTWRRALLYSGPGFPIPSGAPAPAHNEIVLVARLHQTPDGPVHLVQRAMRATTVRLKRFSPWRGLSGWAVRVVGSWELSTHFRLEGVQLTPSDFSGQGPLVRLDPIDAQEVYRRGCLHSMETVIFGTTPQPREDPELHQVFHMLWSRSVGQEGYVKADWKKFAAMLDERGVLR